VGKIIDPVADRLLVITSIFTVAGLGAVPWWFAGATLAREAVVSLMTVGLAAAGAARIDVLWWGKVSTFALMTAYPWFLISYSPHAPQAAWLDILRVVTWVIGLGGLTLAWVVLGGYVRPALSALRRGREARQAGKIAHHGDSRRP
jgi:cardiolipin synthase